MLASPPSATARIPEQRLPLRLGPTGVTSAALTALPPIPLAAAHVPRTVAHATDSSISRALLLLLFADSSSIPRRCSGRSLRTRSLGSLALPAPLFPSQGLPCSLWQCFLCRAPADTSAPPLLVEALCVNRNSERGNRPTAVADASSQANSVPACNAASVMRATEDPPGGESNARRSQVTFPLFLDMEKFSGRSTGTVPT